MKWKIRMFLAVIVFIILILPLVSAPFLTRLYQFTDYKNHTFYFGSPAGTFDLAGTNQTTANYTGVQTINGAFGNTSSSANNAEVYARFNFTINEPLNTINWINISVKGFEQATEGAYLYIYNYTPATFFNTTTALPTANANRSANFTTAFQINNILGTNQRVVVYVRGENFDAAATDTLAIDYVVVTVGYNDTAPQWSSNSTNGTDAGTFIEHSVNLTDQIGLSGYIFEFNNGTSYANDTFVVANTVQNWANVSKWINTGVGASISWRVYFNDTANQVNSTSLFNYTTTTPSANCWTYDSVGKMLIIPTGCVYSLSAGGIQGI